MVKYDEDGLIVKYEFSREDEDWIEVRNKKTPTKRKVATSFRLSPKTILLLKQLAKDNNRSLTNMFEELVQKESHKRYGSSLWCDRCECYHRETVDHIR